MANDKEKVVILGAFAPHMRGGLSSLPYVVEEHQRLQEILAGAKGWAWETLANANYDRIFSAIDAWQEKLLVFHYSGHADSLALRPTGAEAGFKSEGLADLLKKAPHLKLVFLNGCSTLGFVDKLLAAGVPCVIATATRILDDVAQDFATRFFTSLKSGKSIQDAYETAESYILGKDRGHGPDPSPRHFCIGGGAGGGTLDDWGADEMPWLIEGDDHARQWKLPDGKTRQGKATGCKTRRGKATGETTSGSRASGSWLMIFMRALLKQLMMLGAFHEDRLRERLIQDLAEQGVTIACDPAGTDAYDQMWAVVRACLGEQDRRDKLLSALDGIVEKFQYADLHRSIESFTILDSIWPLLKGLGVPISRRKEIYGATLRDAPHGIPLTLEKMAFDLLDGSTPGKFHEFVMRMAKADPDREQSILVELKRIMEGENYRDLQQRLEDEAASAEFHFLSCRLESGGEASFCLQNSKGETTYKKDFTCDCSADDGFPNGIEDVLREALCRLPEKGKPILEFYISSGSLRHRAHNWKWADYSGTDRLPIGTRYPVLVRWSDRFPNGRNTDDGKLRSRTWSTRMKALRTSFTSGTLPEIQWIQSGQNQSKLSLKLTRHDVGIIPAFQFVPVATGASGISPLLETVLNAGIPFCFWFHQEPADWEEAKADVCKLLRDLEIGSIAEKLKELRFQEYMDDKDSALTIFWDDPDRDLLKDVLLPPQATEPNP